MGRLQIELEKKRAVMGQTKAEFARETLKISYPTYLKIAHGDAVSISPGTTAKVASALGVRPIEVLGMCSNDAYGHR